MCVFFSTGKLIDPLVQVKHIFVDLKVFIYDGFGVKGIIRRKSSIGIHGTIEIEVGILVIFVQTFRVTFKLWFRASRI